MSVAWSGNRLCKIGKKSLFIVFPKEHHLPIMAAMNDRQWLTRDNQPWRTRHMGITPSNAQEEGGEHCKGMISRTLTPWFLPWKDFQLISLED